MDPNIKSKHIKGQVQVCNVGIGQIGVKVIDSHKSHRGFDWQLGMRALSFLHWETVTFNLSLFPLKIFSGILVVVTIAAIYAAVAQHCTVVCKLYSFIPPLVYLSILSAWRGDQDWRAGMRVKRWLTLTPWKMKYANQYSTFLYYHFIGFSLLIRVLHLNLLLNSEVIVLRLSSKWLSTLQEMHGLHHLEVINTVSNTYTFMLNISC